MKRTLVCFAVALAVAVSSAAQQGVYTVQEGDNLWNLSGQRLEDPTAWPVILEMNPFLMSPGRIIREDADTVIVIIRPGEELSLNGLEQFGIEAAPIPAPEPSVSPVRLQATVPDYPFWTYLLLLLLLAAVAIGYLVLRRNPVTAGPAMVPGGVSDDTVHEHFAGSAGRIGQNFTIRRIERGRLNGPWTVRYNNGRERRMLLRNETGYRALVQFPDDRRETLYMLQGCGNDLLFTGIERYVPGLGFSFTPDIEVPAARPDEPTQAEEPAPVPAPQVRAGQAVPQPVGAQVAPQRRSLTFSPGDDDKPNMIRTSGFKEVRFEQTGDEMTLRFS